MSNINIYTNNLSRSLRDGQTYIDNYVYVPGTSITGNYATPMVFTSLDDFINTCGDHSPEGSITFEYVSGLLSAGMPVIFRRIAKQKQDTTPSQGETIITSAQATVTVTHKDSQETTIQDAIFKERYGGTFGNEMSIVIRNENHAYYVDAYYKTSLLESKKVATYTDAELATEDTTHVIATRLMTNLPKVEFERITAEIASGAVAATFALTSGTYKLTGGTDFPENLVKAEIPALYNAISDKILYQPKYITSGGYTDSDMTTSSAIATAMKNLTITRGDCIAVIDAAIGTAKDQQQVQAEAISYQQLSDTQPIPQATMLAPWEYMQVGNEQLWMPPSYAYLTRVGYDLASGGKSYTPKAGIASGQVPNIIKPEFEIGSDLEDEWQADGNAQINPIMRLQGGRYIIAGNSTLLKLQENEENAFSELSATMTILEIKRFVYNLATQLQYQYNSATTFETFGLRTSDFLERLISEGAVTDFDIVNVSDSNEPRKLKIRLDVYITPTIKAIDIYLNISYGEVSLVTGGEV